ncbi:MAG: M23 family metallopeptidase [Lysobacteraceae bacterium]
MNIIIVANFLRSPKKLSLRDPRFIAAAGTVLLSLVALGAVVGRWTAGADGTVAADARALHSELIAQRQTIEEARAETGRDIDAMAARLGELQAQAIRLNALGQRLTEIAKLDSGEFDFDTDPALGGPETDGPQLALDQYGLRTSLDELAERLARQSQQLGVLESLMLESGVDADLLPANRPVRSGHVSSNFGMRLDPFTGRRGFHAGIDFSGERGSDTVAAADGVVSFAGRHAAYGNMVDIDHGNGYLTRYAHHSANKVVAGQRVRAGDVIGSMGATGRATGTHLHFEVWHNDKPVNPAQFLKKKQSG